MAVIVNGDGILTGISSLTTSLTDITSGRGTITGVTTVGTLQLGTGVSISSPRSQNAAIFTNNTEFLTVDDAGRVGIAITNPTTKFDVNGTSKFQDDVTFTGATYNASWDKSVNSLIFTDNAKAVFGTGSDLEIKHTGSNSQIIHSGTGNVFLDSIGGSVNLRAGDNAGGVHNSIVCNLDAGVELYFNNSKKFETTTDGTNFTGSIHTIGSGNFYPANDDNVQLGLSNRKWSAIHGVSLNINGGDAEFRGTTPGTTDMTWDQSDNSLKFDDSVKAKFGNSGDLDIYHDGTSSRINNATGNFTIKSNNVLGFYTYSDTHLMARFTAGGSAELYHNNTLKLNTSSAGVTVQNGHLVMNRQDTGNEGGEIVFNRASDNSGQWANDVYGNDSSARIRWHHGGAEKLNLLTNGNVEIPNGNLIIGTAGKGIDFSAQSNASGMTNELLDTYEEGSWTPDIQNRTSAAPNIQEGRYRKIGNQVFAYFHLNFNATVTVSGSGLINIIGLPFTSSSGHSVYGASGAIHMNNSFSVGTNEAFLNILIPPNGTSGNFYFNSGANNAHMPASRMGTGNLLTCIIYFTD